ncbi:2-phosphosulfolactate phosphatase [Sulfuriroseicoccus oceanibius]|uniref:Probable 2-phosphosulfolactate phosphatase n=1 Tax=Sulfuriroseicoccus oceanibius TaxID=2707525 RepID=A0A6B3LEL1_9BACT|nr:2-phosphosulfolactate phosphatase [Sulfuriroseicoccus oceanibius]QQL45850.1 2-phosphosulfolactate phosphatase [Sulfuriroseicoccus oceanibius]
MNITILPGLAGAAKASGVVIVIDVFRAFTVAPMAIARGATNIHPIADVDDALALRDQLAPVESVLIGERHGKKLHGFDFGNSPTEIAAALLDGKSVIQTTHAGTRGLWAVAENGNAVDAILATSFANAEATVIAARKLGTDVTIVPLGWAGDAPTMEDSLCAQYLAARLTEPDLAPRWTADDVRSRLTDADSSARFFDPAQPWSPESDFVHCCNIDSHPTALRFDVQNDGQPARLVPLD